jgi:hypothetical protein
LSEPRPVLELLIGTLFLISIVVVHGTGLRVISRRFGRIWASIGPMPPNWRLNVLLAEVIGSFAVLHLFETFLWALPIYGSGIIPSLRDSYYYVLESYTTLGEGRVSLPDAWRLLGPIIAMSGLFTFGWTGSVLVGVMTEFSKIDHKRAGDLHDS